MRMVFPEAPEISEDSEITGFRDFGISGFREFGNLIMGNRGGQV